MNHTKQAFKGDLIATFQYKHCSISGHHKNDNNIVSCKVLLPYNEHTEWYLLITLIAQEWRPTLCCLFLFGFEPDTNPTLVSAIWWGSINSMNVQDLWPYIFVSIFFWQAYWFIERKAYVTTLIWWGSFWKKKSKMTGKYFHPRKDGRHITFVWPRPTSACVASTPRETDSFS